MKAKCSVYIATSVDGFIAKSDGNIDWLHNPEYNIEGEGFGFFEFIESVSALIMGRNTYEKVLSFGEWPYTKPVFVLTSKTRTVPKHLKNKVHFISGEPSDIIFKLRDEGFQHFYIDGGKTIQEFLRYGLISQLIITKIPILLGEGISLFGPLNKELKLKLISSQNYENGFVKSTYEVLTHK